MTKRKPGAKRGRQPVPIEEDPQRFEIACIWAFLGFGCGPFDAARRALMVVRGDAITMSDVMGVLRLSQVTVPRRDARSRAHHEPRQPVPATVSSALSSVLKRKPPWSAAARGQISQRMEASIMRGLRPARNGGHRSHVADQT
jgi:hypothetical protein